MLQGADHLTVTLKSADDVLQHIDVREEGKENAFSLGRSLWIGNMVSFECFLIHHYHHRDLMSVVHAGRS